MKDPKTATPEELQEHAVQAVLSSAIGQGKLDLSGLPNDEADAKISH